MFFLFDLGLSKQIYTVGKLTQKLKYKKKIMLKWMQKWKKAA